MKNWKRFSELDKIIKVNIEDELYEEHANDIRAALNFLMHNIKTGFKAIPEISRCAKCFLSDYCTSKIEVPVVSEVWFSTNIKHITKNIGD